MKRIGIKWKRKKIREKTETLILRDQEIDKRSTDLAKMKADKHQNNRAGTQAVTLQNDHHRTLQTSQSMLVIWKS